MIIVPSQFDWLSGRPVTVVFGLIYGWIPYFIIPLYAALARFDTRYLEASRDLGAGGFQTFFHVTLPLSQQPARNVTNSVGRQQHIVFRLAEGGRGGRGGS